MRAPPAESQLENLICERLQRLRLRRQAEYIENGGGYWHNPFTQRAIAQRLGVSNKTVNKWENDLSHHPRSLARFDQWARLLGSSLHDELAAAVAKKVTTGDLIARALGRSETGETPV